MTKPATTKPATTRGSRAAIETVRPPKTIDLATGAIGVVILGLAGRALGLLGSTGTLNSYLIDLNARAKKPVANYVRDHLAGDLHSLRVSAVIQSIVVAVALVLIVFALRRTRTAGGSRWALLIIVVLTALPFYVIPVSGWPVLPKVSGVLTGVAAIASLVLVFVPASSAYFRQCRDAMTPPELRGQPKKGLGALFGPRPPRAARPRAGAPTGAAQRPAAARNVSSSRSRAKVRSDADSVARGAELARSRAKASKSRRTDS